MASKPSKAKAPKVSVTISNPKVQKTSKKKTKEKNPSRSVGNKSPAMEWLRLLGDPCGAKLVRPCYAGVDAGYLIRTTDVVPLSFNSPTALGTSGQVIAADLLYQWTPWNASLSSGLVLGACLKGGAFSNTSNIATVGTSLAGISNFITNSTAVKAYRPVASCLRYLPDGPYSTRQGSVGLFSMPNLAFNPSTTPTTANTTLTLCGSVAPNGSTTHEVRWLPSSTDEAFTTVGATGNQGCGTIGIILAGVDTTVSGGTNLTGTFNGRMEIITVWEWQPASTTSDITLNLQSPLPYTSQQVLSTISDMGNFAYQGMGRAMQHAGYAGMSTLLTSGVQTLTRRAQGLLLGS